jgi:sec-independent protein translocase protein TatB
MSFSFAEIAFFVLLGLVLFGPKRLPEIARQMGKFMAEFRRASNDEINKLELEEHAKAIKSATEGIMPPAEDPDSISAALSRLSDRIKSIPRDFDA